MGKPMGGAEQRLFITLALEEINANFLLADYAS